MDHVSDGQLSTWNDRLDAIAQHLHGHVIVNLGRLIAHLVEILALRNSETITAEDRCSCNHHNGHRNTLNVPELVIVEIVIGHDDDTDDAHEEEIVEWHHAHAALESVTVRNRVRSVSFERLLELR